MTQSLSPAIRRTIRNTLGDALQRAVRRSPNKEALVFGERRWTYQDLNQAVNRVAHALHAQGGQYESTVPTGQEFEPARHRMQILPSLKSERRFERCMPAIAAWLGRVCPLCTHVNAFNARLSLRLSSQRTTAQPVAARVAPHALGRRREIHRAAVGYRRCGLIHGVRS